MKGEKMFRRFTAVALLGIAVSAGSVGIANAWWRNEVAGPMPTPGACNDLRQATYDQAANNGLQQFSAGECYDTGDGWSFRLRYWVPD
ncbi:hypothetical protein [Nocardia asteroides]|uniref:hypothetical protein n=1 Tax=Nocardia asteroides TaxID=1824 RepID=UPI0033F846B0